MPDSTDIVCYGRRGLGGGKSLYYFINQVEHEMHKGVSTRTVLYYMHSLMKDCLWLDWQWPAGNWNLISVVVAACQAHAYKNMEEEEEECLPSLADTNSTDVCFIKFSRV